MPHKPDEVREIVAELDRLIGRVRRLTTRPEMQPDASHALDDLRVARHRLRDIGHASHFDSPPPTEPDAA